MGKAGKNTGRSRAIRIAAAVFVLAVFVRGGYLYESSDNPTFLAPVVDSLTYDQMARGLVEGKGLTHEFFWQPLFYPLFLSLVYWLSNCSVLWVKIFQVVLGAVTCVLSYRLGEKLFGPRIGILSGVITAVYVPLVFFEAELLAVGWAAFWSVALVLALIRAAEKLNIWRCLVLGLVGALGIITRPVFLPFFAAGCAWLLLVWARGHSGISKPALGVAAIAGGFVLVAGPAAFLSYEVMGKVRILPYSGGVNLYIGNNPNYKETINTRPGLAWRKLMRLPGEYGITDEYEKERFFADKAIDYAMSEPVSFLKGLVYKSAQFLSSREMPRNVDIYLFRKWSSLLRLGVWKSRGFGFPFGLLLAAAVVGGVYGWRKMPAPIWLFVILYPAAVILVFVTSRYRMPIVPVISVLSAAGCAAVWQALRGQQWAKVGTMTAIVLGVAFAGSAAGPFYAEQLDYQPELYYALADSLDKHGRTGEAVEAYSEATRLRPDYVEAHHNLALLLVRQERISEAVGNYNKALELDPENAGLHEDFGMAFFKLGRVEDAIRHYERAIEIDPKKASAYDNLGTAYLRLNRPSEALEYYSKAVAINPNDAISHNNIGNIFAMQGRFDKAAEHYEISLRIRPGDPETLNNLGNVFAGLGEYEKAVQEYRDALEVAPGDAGIYRNLGRCLEQQGRIDEAIEVYRRALEIEPDDSRTRRALERLAR